MRTITRFLRRFLILLIVFVMGVAGTAFLMNNETTDDRSDMNNPTLPEVMVGFNGTAQTECMDIASRWKQILSATV